MSLSQALLPEFDMETASTRKTLERIPDEKFAWKPHEKSFELGALATHIANLVSWGVNTINDDFFDMAPPDGPPWKMPEAGNREDVLAMFDRNVTGMRAALAAASDEHLLKSWALKSGGEVLFEMPRIAVLRSFVFNHLIHHRAQLGVYLRLNDIPVPSIYGPSADESGM